MNKNDPEHVKTVASLPPKKDVIVGKPRIVKGFHNRRAFPSTGGVSMGVGGNPYSPEISTDFLQLPQTRDEQRHYYRFFYDNDPFVGQAIDLHGELPLSKLRLRKPRAKNKKLADASMRFCERWVKHIGLLHRLMEIVHDLNLIGEVFPFAEDTNPEMPRDVTHETYREIKEDGTLLEEEREYPDAKQRASKWMRANYKGWTSLRVLPPEQIEMESFTFTDKTLIELVPDSKTRELVQRAQQGDIRAREVVESMPVEIVQYILRGDNIPLNTNPHAGSFCGYLARKKSSYEERGKSILQRCIRILVHRDKLRQAQASIASRHMTPCRVVWSENLNDAQIEDLREQIDLALLDPDYSIIVNFQVNWEEMTSDQRLLDLSSEYDLTDRQLYAGLGVTESLLSGESSYSGDRIHLEVINIRYLLLRELLQDYVDNHLLAPMCKRMGFIEIDEDGHEVVIHPRLSFTRLALRDNQETFDALFNLYQKGSLDLDTILDLLNIDPDTVREKLEKDLFTLQDATFNEVLRSAYSRAGDSLIESSDLVPKIAEELGLVYSKPKEEGMSRYGGSREVRSEALYEMIKEAVREVMK